LAEAETERRWQVWVRVRLGSEKRIDVARAYGYKDGSAISQIIKRLEAEDAVRRELGVRISRLQAAFEQQMSSVDSAEEPLTFQEPKFGLRHGGVQTYVPQFSHAVK
jgi:hypothetical protein